MVGGPFSGKTPEDQERNIVATELLGIQVAEAGGAPIVPNSMGRTWKGSPSYEVWIDITKAILARCDAFIVTPNWEQSSGTRAEIEEAFFACIPVFYDIEALSEWLRLPDYEIRTPSPETKRRLRAVEAGVRLVQPLTDQDRKRAEALSPVEQVRIVADAVRAAQSLGHLGRDINRKIAEYEQMFLSRLASVDASLLSQAAG
jgi:hypothetical protein